MATPSQSGFGKQSPQSSLPPLSLKNVNAGTWGAGGNTLTILDEYIKANSRVAVWVTGLTPQAGHWSYVITPGSCVVTSSSSESSSLPVAYVIF